jgi:hypothetical protein
MFAISRQEAPRASWRLPPDALIFAADIDATALIITLFAAADTSPLLPPHFDFDSLRRRYAAFVHAFRLSPLPAAFIFTPILPPRHADAIRLPPSFRDAAATVTPLRHFAITPAILIFFEAPRHFASRRFLRRLFSPAPLLSRRHATADFAFEDATPPMPPLIRRHTLIRRRHFRCRRR